MMRCCTMLMLWKFQAWWRIQPPEVSTFGNVTTGEPGLNSKTPLTLSALVDHTNISLLCTLFTKPDCWLTSTPLSRLSFYSRVKITTMTQWFLVKVYSLVPWELQLKPKFEQYIGHLDKTLKIRTHLLFNCASMNKIKQPPHKPCFCDFAHTQYHWAMKYNKSIV